jgi:Rad3-related DNA helicase
VRNLVEFIFREGDIDNRHGRAQSADAMLEGTRIHRMIQKEQAEGYMAEVPLHHTMEQEAYVLTVEGRADGIFTDEIVYIDEIKGIYRNLALLEEPVYVHKAQAMCYAYIFALQNELSRIGVQMTYCNLDTKERKIFREEFSFEEISAWFDQLMQAYGKWADFECRWKKTRQESIGRITFPYEYRKGQKKLVEDVYRTIARQKNLFIQAPTGVGKTISAIFPAVKAVGQNLGDRIFYLTAKTVTATVARETFGLLMEQGYRGKTIQITAKEKLCLCDEMECNPVNCPYAKGHFDRVNDAVYDLLQKADLFTREDILSQAKAYTVCPFELGLDVATWADNIICDYNYVFDPNVYLKRFFQEGVKGDYIFLVDEAHNLVERSRSMYSASVCKEDFLTVRRIVKPYSKSLDKLLEKCNRILLEHKRQCENYRIYEDIGNLLFSFMQLAFKMDEFLQNHMEFAGRKDVLDFYFELRNFLNIYELTDERYVIYSEFTEEGAFVIRLFCVDPSENLQKCLDKARSTIFFSATLLPIHYYKRLLSTVEDNYAIYAESPFSEERRFLAIGGDVSTKYTRRTPEEFSRIAQYILKTVRCRTGNYMVFFPSYKLMNDVYRSFCGMTSVVEINVSEGESCAVSNESVLQWESDRLSGESCIEKEAPLLCMRQKNGMDEVAREAFLQEFETQGKRTLVAFCVMGGIFGEGIDLKKDQLIGAIVVGTGLPQISNEREILKNYYDEQSGNGFDYAFRYPGINKVLQAAGRVIRTAEDRGVILLLDERFRQRDYSSLYPREWEKRSYCTLDTVEELVRGFWEQ